MKYFTTLTILKALLSNTVTGQECNQPETFENISFSCPDGLICLITGNTSTLETNGKVAVTTDGLESSSGTATCASSETCLYCCDKDCNASAGTVLNDSAVDILEDEAFNNAFFDGEISETDINGLQYGSTNNGTCSGTFATFQSVCNGTRLCATDGTYSGYSKSSQTLNGVVSSTVQIVCSRNTCTFNCCSAEDVCSFTALGGGDNNNNKGDSSSGFFVDTSAWLMAALILPAIVVV